MSGKFKLLFILFFTYISLSGLAQDSSLQKSISISPGEYQLSDLFIELRRQGIPLAFSENLIPKTNCVVDRSYSSLDEFLKLLQSQERFEFSEKDGLIVLRFNANNQINTIRGFVRDKSTGEALIGAVVYKPGTIQGVVTNNYGYFSFSLTAEQHPVHVSFVGFKTYQKTYDLSNGGVIEIIELEESISKLDEITISSVEPDFNVTSLIPGINTLDLNTEGVIPYFLGEVDILQGATYLPGINTLGEDANGIHVRGGASDQNLILLDEATIYNPNHLSGLISIFNPHAINHVEIMKGFIPAWHGGRASSVISVTQKDGDDKQFHMSGSIGLVSAKLIAEGPLKKNKSSFIFSGRQSIFDISPNNASSSRFQDINTKVNWKPNKKNTIHLAGYWGNDRNVNVLDTKTQWGNRNLSLRWNHLFGKKVFSNVSAILSEYNYKITQPREAASFIGQSKILDYTLKSDFSYILNPQNEIRMGATSILHILRPGSRVPFDVETSSSNPIELDSEHGLESAFYMSHQLKVSRKLELQYGLRFSNLVTFGADTTLLYDENSPKSISSVVDTLIFEKGSVIQSDWRAEPRISLNYKITPSSSVKMSYTRSNQYLHLISNTITPSPTDIWKLSDQHIRPTSSDHYSLGYYQNFSKNTYEAYIDFYYKDISNLISYKDGAQLLFNKNPETELLSASGRNYGLEVYLKKNEGKITGWLSYTLSRSEQRADGQFEEEQINNGRYFPTNNDRQHDFTFTGIYQLNRRMSTSMVFNYQSGRPYSLPLGKYTFEGNAVPYFGMRNQQRLPDYHRLDWSLKFEGRPNKRNGDPKLIQDYWTFVLYNVYGRDNVYSYLFQQNEATGFTEIIPNSIFNSIIPAVTYNFKF
ncbi:MAG: TonB-dependent receptor [Cyclobacteriaceae bacterium]